MPPEVEQRRGDVFGRLEALVVIAGEQDTLHELGRHDFTRLVVRRVHLQHLGLARPVFENLSREFSVVTRTSGRARKRRVTNLRHETVQAMAELVEQRLDIRKAHQGRFARRRHRQIQVVRDQRAYRVAADIRCHAVRTHPRTAALGVTCIHVGHEQAEMIAFRVLDLE